MSKQLFYMKVRVDSHVVKKNNRPIWRGRLGKSSALRNAEAHLETTLRRAKSLIPNLPITEYVQAKMTFHFPKEKYFTKKGSINRKLPDISNLYQLPEDCLQKAGILFDDHLIDNHDGSRRVPSDGYYLEIELISIG